jgi:hypothetical protein
MTLVLCSAALTASAQTPQSPPDASAPSAPTWSARASVATYILPDDDNYVQPTVTADGDALHLEGRYNYEDRHSFSGFVGWNLEAGSKVKLEVTPMFGGVVGDTNGVIPAIEATLSFSRFEAYSEGEYVIDVDNHDDRFLYNWSEVSVWATDWLRAGLVTQRTRTFLVPQHSERDIQRGLLAGVSIRKVEGTFYLFNPGSDDYYVVASISLSF